MSRARIMGAGSAGSLIYNTNVNLKTCGGNKKQGFPFSLDGERINHHTIQHDAVGTKRNVVFIVNQLGGVSSSSFSSSAHGHATGDSIRYQNPFVCFK